MTSLSPILQSLPGVKVGRLQWRQGRGCGAKPKAWLRVSLSAQLGQAQPSLVVPQRKCLWAGWSVGMVELQSWQFMGGLGSAD
jgi:hypothetical protein